MQARVPHSVQIGSVRISPATVLAPMAGVTDTVFRRFIRNLGGCGLIMTEFTSADGVLRAKDKKAKRYLHFYEDEHPISAQLFGSDPHVMADAARIVEDLGFDLVDLNLGCPAVKFRAGWNDEEIVCVELAKIAEDCGLCAVALHARTREQGYSGNARWEWIAAIKDAVKIPVIGNGDIRTPEDACAMVAATGCDAVMIGRTAPANPWIFRQIEQYCAWLQQDREGKDWEAQDREGHDFSRAEKRPSLPALAAEAARAKAPTLDDQSDTTEVMPFPSVLKKKPFSDDSSSKPYDEPSESDRYEMIRTYFSMLIEEELPDATGKMKQFASWFTHGVPGGAGLRKAIYDSKMAPEILSRVEEFFETRLANGSGTVQSAAQLVP
ncbi:MAG: tRNA-dihydrouridine synthase [Acidobacteria bacterium]|nr:MAG: tRNA-dihydrouridine synthase [Acidobacteriota bacterium]